MDQDVQERLKSALWYSIGQATDAHLLESSNEANATPQFIGALTELVWSQISNAAKDLESFAKHAGRVQITTDDVMLLARRNEGLESLLSGYVEEIRRDRGVPKALKKTVIGNGKGKAKKN